MDLPATWISTIVFALCAAAFLALGLALMWNDPHSPFGTTLIFVAAVCAIFAVRQVRELRRPR